MLPSDTAVLPIVTELFNSAALLMLESVLLYPLIVLLLSVCEPVVVTTAAPPTVADDAVTELNVPAAGVVPPIATPSIVPPVSAAPLELSVVNVPAAGVVPPITALLIVPPVIVLLDSALLEIVLLERVKPVNEAVEVKPVPEPLTTTSLFALPVSAGSLSKPAEMVSSSARSSADEPADPATGNVEWL